MENKNITAAEILSKHEDLNEYHFHEVDKKWIIEAMEEYSKVLKEQLENLQTIIKSDSVYTLLRGGHKRPSMTGVDDCEDDLYYDLYQYCVLLRQIDSSKINKV